MDSLESDARAYMVNNQNEPMTNASLVVKPNNTHHADQRNIPIHAKEWKRAIPESGYITLGTIRYGVKLSQGCLSSNCTHTRSSSLSTAEYISKTNSSKKSASNTHTPSIEHDMSHTNGLTKNTECSSSMPNVCDSDTSLSDVNGSCCLNTTKCSLPWINKTDSTRTIDLSKNRIVGLGRSLPTETVNDASVDQPPFSNSETNKISDKSSYVNQASVNSYVDDFSAVENSRQAFSTQLSCRHILTNQINNRKLITSPSSSQQAAEQKQSIHYLDVISRNQNKRIKNYRQSPTRHFHPIECECGALQSRNSSEKPTLKSCHIENRKVIKAGHKFSGNVIQSIVDPSWIDANNVCANDFQVNNNHTPKYHCSDSEYSEQCCFCCYSDCKRGAKLKSNYKCDDQSVERSQLQVKHSNQCYSSDDCDTNPHTHLNNNCKFYKNQNHDQNSFCKSETSTDTDIFSNSAAKCLVHDSSFHSAQLHIDYNSTTPLNARNSSDKSTKSNRRKNDPTKHLRRSHSINENCSDCVGQLDKQFIRQIKRLQSGDSCAKNYTESVPITQKEQKKLVCCSKNVTAVRKTATLFVIGSNSSNLVGNQPKINDKSELVQDKSVDTCQNSQNNNNYQINNDRNCELYKTIDNNNLLTSILPQKESHSKNADRNQIINYKIRFHRTHLKSDYDENRLLYPVKQHKNENDTFANEYKNDRTNDNDDDDDGDDNDENLCHLEKLNLAESSVVGLASSEQVKQKLSFISSTYRNNGDDNTNNGATTQITAAPLLDAVENELLAVDISKQSEHIVNSIECTDQSATLVNNPCKIVKLKQTISGDTVQTSESKRSSSTSDNEITDQCASEQLLNDRNAIEANNKYETNDECMLFEQNPVPPDSLNFNRFLNRRASFDNSVENDFAIFVNHRRTNSSDGEAFSFDRQSKLNRSNIESISDRYRYIQNTDHRYAHYLTPNTLNMEKRFNTLDRWQRLRFGRRAASNPPEDKKPSNADIELAAKRSSDKLERLREITELLKVPRNNTQSPVPQSAPTESTSSYEFPPPVPPPRKPRTSLRNSGSIEKFIDTSASESGSPIMSTKFDHSINENKSSNSTLIGQSTFHVPTSKPSLIETLRPNASVSNLENIIKTRDKDKIMLPVEEEKDVLSQSESRPPVGSHAPKAVPFRSASFSHGDYSSGKYIRSALGVLKASLSKAKSPPLNFSCRKERSGSSSPEDTKIPNECTDIWIPLKGPCDKRNDLNLDLIDASATANMILEEDSEHSPISNKSDMYSESLSSPLSFKTVKAAQVTVDSPYDEGAAMQNVDSSFQAATSCMIPIPVYERENSDSSLKKNTVDGNVRIQEPSKSDDIPVFSEIYSDKDGEKSKRNSRISELKAEKLRRKAQSPTLEIDLPAIAVTPGSSISGSSFEEMDNSTVQQPNRSEYGSEYGSDYGVEVRKRFSNEDKSSNENKSDDSNQSTSTSGTNSPKSHHDEKRRIDKSKRRKGMYIQWATLDKHNKELNAVSWTLGGDDRVGPEIDANGQPVWPIGTFRSDNLQVEGHDKPSNSLSSIEAASPDSAFTLSNRPRSDSTGKSAYASYDETQPTSASCEVFTPDSECDRQPVWPQRGTLQSRRQSLTLQSSEEKDESSPPTSKPRSKIFMLRSDSISDNEMSDRTPPPRDRTSQSPAPDHDLKRYSKRPLRGPYGQMLEAEMKKPAKQNYDGLLEELNRSESPYMLSAKQRDSNLLSYDELPPCTQRSISLCKNSASRKSSETENSLPIPLHIRAASTPAHIETPRTDTVHSHHKRYPSCVETSPRKETKKYSTDSYMRITDDRYSKRALSESKEKITKRNASSPAGMSLLSTANEKLHRFNTDDRGKSPIKQNTLPIKATPELLAQLLSGSSEKMTTAERERNKKQLHVDAYALPTAVQQFLRSDTRTHIVVELFNTEKSYVDSLETVVKKYLNPLKSQENASLIEAQTVDEIFLMVPAILHIHQQFLDELRSRLEIWDPVQRVGDAFVQVFSTSAVLETYTLFVNNVNRAKTAIRTTCNQRPAFARFLESMAREHKGKLTLDNLLIKPVQKFPNYELMFQRLIKHTDDEHPDQKTLQEALKLVHDILLHLNCKEREALENDQREATLRELEGVIENISDLVSCDRQFLSFDLVSMPHGQGGRKERGFFLFNDLLIITSIKRRSGTIKKPSTTCPISVASTLDTNKYKLLMKIAIEDLEVIKAKDENVRKIMREIEYLTEDCTKLQQMIDIAMTLRCPHQHLEENMRELQKDLQRQLNDRQSNDSQLCVLELAVNQSGSQVQHMTVVFPKSEKRAHWEKMFHDVKLKITAALDHQPIPEFIDKVSIRKTRAGLQFTCAAATLGAQKDVWVCNSDGYVGQVCVLSLSPEPTVTSCNGVCNARILCLASVPAFNRKLNDSIASLSSNASSSPSRKSHGSSNLEKKTSNVSTKSIASNDSSGGGTNSSSGNERDMQLDSSSSSDDSDEPEQNQPLRRLNSAKANSTPQLSTSAPNSSSDHSHITDESSSNDNQQQQPTMWLGTEDGCIHVYNCTDNIRTKKNKIKMQLSSAIYSILYLDNRVFVSLANGELIIYSRDHTATWNYKSPQTMILGSATNPISKLLNVNGKLWCSVQGTIKVMNSSTLQMENQLQISSDIKPITNMAVYNNQVWISIQNSAQIKCFHSKSLALLFEVNLAPSVNKMLSNCDDIIRQHKAACLRVTSLLACKDLIWIGTSAGVILTIPAASCKSSGGVSTYSSILDQPIVTGIPYGHTGHVRFITCVDHMGKLPNNSSATTEAGDSTPQKKKNAANKPQASTSKLTEHSGLLIISGGDGFEDFRSSGTSQLSDIAGREDSTNHLLLWQV